MAPRYFYHSEDGRRVSDELGTVLPDLTTAKREAARRHAAMMQDTPDVIDAGSFRVLVTDERGLTLLMLDTVVRLGTGAPQ